MSKQIAFPARIEFIGGAVASAIATGKPVMGKRPRYQVSGIEEPTFDPTIPDDLAAAGWYWWGSALVCGEIVVAAAASLDEYWSAARHTTTTASMKLDLPARSHQPVQLAFL